MTAKPINDRALQILKIIVERYIREGQPVGSKSLAEQNVMSLSSASIRNIMADLEEAGYLHSPHTSAGRVPTIQGYRLFVDSLLTVQPLQQIEVQQLESQLGAANDLHSLVASASNMLSMVTQLAGIVTLPRRQQLTLRQVEFLPLSAKRILVVLVTNEYEVQNRIINIDRTYSASELQQAGNFLTHHFAGKELTDIRQALYSAMQNDRKNVEQMMQPVMEMADKAFTEEERMDYVLVGEANLFSVADEVGIKGLRSLFEAFNQKRDILHLLDQCLNAQGVQIFIGEESGYQAFDTCSLVTAPYHAGGKIVGVLGVIGPTRMPYERVISAVDITSKLLSAVMAEKSKEA